MEGPAKIGDMHICIYVYVYICIYVYMYISITRVCALEALILGPKWDQNRPPGTLRDIHIYIYTYIHIYIFPKTVPPAGAR